MIFLHIRTTINKRRRTSSKPPTFFFVYFFDSGQPFQDILRVSYKTIMRKSLYILLLSALSIGSCSESVLTLEEIDLIGEWRSSPNTFINEMPASDFLNGGQLYSSILGLQEENFYFLDYSSGQWSINGDELTLSQRGKFKILDFQDDRFLLEGEILASQLYWNLEGISDNERITIKQEYLRQ